MTWFWGDDVRPMGYRVIYADPAWLYKNWSKKGEWKNANRHYRCMPIEEIRALPVRDLAAGDCVLYLWTTWPFLEQAFSVINAWGFTYKSGGAWRKLSPTGRSEAFGPGYIERNACDPYLIATIGEPKRYNRAIRNIISAPIREHSRKPDEMRERLERLLDGPYIELFSRSNRPGWTAWGDEAGKFDAAA